MKLRLSLRARQDVIDIGRYVRARSPQGAGTIRSELQAALRTISEHPETGRALGGGLHRFVVPRAPYLIFYRFEPAVGAVSIVTIRHGARDPASSPDRDET